jgi:ribosomal protein S12 methylthiotransferase accessory factor
MANTAKGYRQGTDRLVPPVETLDRVRPFLPAMGITRIANVTGLDVIGVPVVMACRPNSRGLAVAQGKGLTLDAAKASAVMETIEGYHGEHITLPLVLGTFDELRAGRRLIDAFRLWTGESGPFVGDRPQLWTQGVDLVRDEAVWVPLDAVHSDFTFDAQLGRPMLDSSSNGLASGNHPLEAVSHALCELIERDATALWSLLPADTRRSSRLDLATVDDPGCVEVLSRLEAARIAVAVWEITSDIGLPVFGCQIAEDPDHGVLPLYGSEGFGCHPRREIALLRALTEAVQSRLTFIAGSRDDMFRTEYETARDRHALDRLWATVAEPVRGRGFRQMPTSVHDSFEEDVALEVARMRAVGVNEVVVVDLTRPEFDIPVVRAVVPLLEYSSGVDGYRPRERALAFQAGQAARS